MFNPLNESGEYDVECLTPNWCEAQTVYVEDIIRQCVLFLGNKDEKTGRFRPRATAFVVSLNEGDVGHRYLVTAEHNVSGFQQKGWDMYLRSNIKGGGIREDKIDDWHWTFHPDPGSTDVAVTPIGFLPDEEFKQVVLRSDPPDRGILGTTDYMNKNRIGLGDEVFIIGLFRSHFGQQRNIPIVRVGNLAMMKGEPVYTEYCGYTEAHLIEARSIHGLSGSPVFIHTPVPHRLNVTEFRLIGLMHGHFDVKNLNEDIVIDSDHGDTGGINTGIGVVIPVEKIMETIDQPELVEMRRKSAIEHRKKYGASSDCAGDDGPAQPAESVAPPATGPNPKHREDFTRLVNAAARKPEPKD